MQIRCGEQDSSQGRQPEGEAAGYNLVRRIVSQYGQHLIMQGHTGYSQGGSENPVAELINSRAIILAKSTSFFKTPLKVPSVGRLTHKHNMLVVNPRSHPIS